MLIGRQETNDFSTTLALTQQDIASIISVSREFIKDVENTNKTAKCNFRHINVLVEYFEMSPREFLPGKALKLNSRSNLKQTRYEMSSTLYEK